MRTHVALVVCFTAVLLLPNVGWSQTAPNESQITQARLKGVEFLKSKQLDDGSWEFPGHEVGITALCTLALLENGLPQSDPVIDKGHRFVKKSTKELGSTYDIALSIVLLSRLDEYGNKQTIRDLGARLIAGQNTGGGWSYTCPAKITSSILTNPETRPKPPEGVGDNSCTQFAVLGLWTASRTGMDIDQPMAAIARRFRTTQNSDGGWPYTTTPAQGDKAAAPNPSGSAMTFAGLFSLTVARANKLRKQLEEKELSGDDKSKTSGSKKAASSSAKKKDEKPDEKKDAPSEAAEKTDEGATLVKDPIFAKGLERAGQFVQGGDQARYFLWTIERLGVLLGLEKIGGVDWFAKGADILLKTQQPDGSWPESHNDKGLSQTSFAILFLRKANLGSDISRLLEGLKFEFDPPEIGATVAWTAVRVAGGSVRMLNCSITEEGRKGAALIEITEPSQLRLQNCLLGGGRAAVEIAAKGSQSLDAENSLLFSDQCVTVVKQAAAKEADTKLAFHHCTWQGTNAIHAPTVATPIAVTADGCLFKTDNLGLAFLAAENLPKDRSWSGENNIYGVSKWVGASNRAATSVTDAKSFAKFWGIEDKGSAAKTVVFEGKRPSKSSSHRMRATEFALGAQSELALSGTKSGMQFLIVGSGRAFSRYRESSLYSDWKKSLAAAP
jgi:hypothetical protein